MPLCAEPRTTGERKPGRQAPSFASSLAAFTLGTTRLDLGPGESAPVTLTFAPTASGHQAAEITAVASATNQTSVHFLSHGYGGAAPGTGPLPVAEAVFYSGLAGGTLGILPNGTRFVADTNVHACVTQQNGPGFGDYCLTDADCAANSGTCALTGTCVRGDRAGQPCSRPDDCPNGFCPTSSPFDPIDTAHGSRMSCAAITRSPLT